MTSKTAMGKSNSNKMSSTCHELFNAHIHDAQMTPGPAMEELKSIPKSCRLSPKGAAQAPLSVIKYTQH